MVNYGWDAPLVGNEDRQGPDDYRWCVGVRVHQDTRLRLLVAQACALRWDGKVIHPGVLLDPETGCLFLGRQERLVADDLHAVQRLWVDHTESGFWGRSRHGDVVFLAAELELAAWDGQGRKLWATFVEPPWHDTVADRVVHVTVLDVGASFPLTTGPNWGAHLPWLA